VAVRELSVQDQRSGFSAKRFVIALVAGLAVPFVARALLGRAGLTSYFPSWSAGFTVLAMHIPCCAIVALFAGLSKTWGWPFGFSAVGTFSFLIWSHLTLDLSKDAQAGIALLLIPVVAIPIALLTAAIGGAVRFVVNERR
jgi:hypothetical protein